MKLDSLTSYGILPAFIERWRDTIGEHLLDWQADALTHYNLLDSANELNKRNNLLVIAPTSSGKTFIGELATAAALSRRKKAIFIVPLKAIAAEKHDSFNKSFGNLGFKTIISTRDHRHFDATLSSGNFDIAIVVAEKLRHLLTKKIDLLERVDLIVADELHLLADPDRGPALLSIIEKLARADFACRFIGLSTRLPAADFMANLLGARILRVCRRPIELRRGILYDGIFRYREDNSGDVGTEQLGDPGDYAGEDVLQLIAKQLTAGEQILVFGKSKVDCHYRAAALARLCALRNELDEHERWTLSAGGPVVAGLAEWYAKGIGLHHADLSFAQRRLTERLFHAGKLQIIFCTGTLAMGVNLPASIVYLEAERFAGGRHGGAPYLTALEPHEFDNAAGRAGRLGYATSCGRAILCAGTPVETDILWQTYVAVSPTDSSPHLKWPTTERRILEAIACKLIFDNQSCDQYFAGLSENVAEEKDDYAQHIENLVRLDLLAIDDAGHWHATPAGLVAASSGVSPSSIQLLRNLVTGYNSPDPILWTAAVLALPESADLRWPRRFAGPFDTVAASWHEQFGDDFETTMRRSFPDTFRPELWYPQPYLRRRAMAIALAMGDWAAGQPAEQLTTGHQAPLGRFEQTAETISWLIETATALAEAAVELRSKAPALGKTSFEVRRGLPFSLSDLAEALGLELPREAILHLDRLGWNKPQSLAAAQASDLGDTFPAVITEQVIRRSRKWMTRFESISSATNTNRDGNFPSSVTPQRSDQPGGKQQNLQDNSFSSTKEVPMSGPLNLDGRRVRSRFAIKLGEHPCTLRAKSFKYLFALAAARCLRQDGWVDKRDVEAGENQIKYFYQLRQELKTAFDGAQRLVENDGAGRYRLALPREMIHFNLKQIAEFPDCEIQKAAEKLGSQIAGFKAA